MKISYKWLQSYFEEKLPAPEALAERITFSFAEIEGVEKKGDDTILDIKVLPDRACYALSHRGVAYEVSAITGLKKKEVEYPAPEVKKTRPLSVRVEAMELCQRYMAQVVENVSQKEMSWVKGHLEAVGQRSINPIVDGANVVMFDRGQPLHAFDADKVEGDIIVRRARKGEKITTLDNRNVDLDKSILIIADEKGPLAIAGIKGGKKAEVTAETKSLILESASFNASYIRKTSEKLGIRTDASKRYENKFSPSFADKGMADFSAYLFEMDKNASFGEIEDVYLSPVQERSISITPEYIGQKLGVKLLAEKAREILERLLIKVSDNGSGWVLTPPVWRADLVIPEDIAEEVGRIYGYDNIFATLPSVSKETIEIPRQFYFENRIRSFLVSLGFSEVMTSSFGEAGYHEIEKPLAKDKAFARASLREGFTKSLSANTLLIPLLGVDSIRQFEIGTVFTKDGEYTALAIGAGGEKKKVKGVLEETLKTLEAELGAPLLGEEKDNVYECSLTKAIEKLPEPTLWDITIPESSHATFETFSPYPFIVRDVALFVSSDTSFDTVASVIRENAGTSVVRGPSLFDEFEKEGRKSLAFRIVFQASDRTLTDEEVNATMKTVYDAALERGWTVR